MKSPVMYNAFRQYLFVTPPLFIFAGLTLQQIISRVKKPVWAFTVTCIVIIPGLFSIFQNHPFQYMYYNAFTGGIEGAYENYDFDYYNIAYKDAMDYVNENLPSGSKILIWKDNLLGKIYAERDLEFKFTSHVSIPEKDYQNYDYAIMPTGRFDDLTSLKDLPVVHSVDIQNVSLLVILEITEDAD
jgi:hypothetical protein